MRVLITGISGFVGSHLVEMLHTEHPDAEIVGLVEQGLDDGGAFASGNVRLVAGDLLDASSIMRTVEAAEPDLIFHLAAASSVAGSWDAPNVMLQVNVLGTLHLLEAVRLQHSMAKVVLACSAEAYGVVARNELPIREEQPFRPVSPYAVSKAAVDLFGFQYHRSCALSTVRLRLFNQCGPRQTSRFVVASLARQIAEIEAGLRSPRLLVGNTEVRRDFVDVRDGVRAFWAAATAGEPGAAYNVCSGHARSIREILDALLAMSAVAIEVAPDPSLTRPADLDILEGDPSRFHAATGWEPRLPFSQTLADTLDFWRSSMAAIRR